MNRLAEFLGRSWPLSALGVWALALSLAMVWPLPGLGLGLGLALLYRRPWRRAWVALGVPLGFVALGLSPPAWVWLGAALLLLALYPLRLWRDAPLFHTPAGALQALRGCLDLESGAPVLDAGCGAGAGLRELRRVFAQAELHGCEASPLLALWARWRCPWARVRCADLWREDWRGYRLIYLFQRPESMAAALDKARRELGEGAWLLSLDFPLPGPRPRFEAALPGERHRLFLYAAAELKA